MQSNSQLQFVPPEVRSHTFEGGFNETARSEEYDGTAGVYRCGFQAQSGFNVLGFSDHFKKCKVVVATLVARGRDVLLHPVNLNPDHVDDPRVCFVAAMDINGRPLVILMLYPSSIAVTLCCRLVRPRLC